MTFVGYRQNLLTLDQAVAAMTIAPARNLNLDRGTLSVGAPADVAVFDPARERGVVAGDLASKSKNTPFDGWSMTGKVTRTIVGGRSVWEDAR